MGRGAMARWAEGRSLALGSAAALVAAIGLACSGNSPGGNGEATAAVDSTHAVMHDEALTMCEPPADEMAEDVSAAELAGEYTLILIASGDGQTVERAEGALRLTAYHEPPVTTVGPPPVLYGATTLDPTLVGAVDTGDPAAIAPDAPGVMVFEWTERAGDEATTRVVIRVGALTNRLDQLRFDGAYTALRVYGVGEKGFNGTWESGGPDKVAGGHFCAVRP